MLAGKNKLVANLNLKGKLVPRIPVHDPKQVTELTMRFIFIYNNLPNEICRETCPSKVSTLKNTVLNDKREHNFLSM